MKENKSRVLLNIGCGPIWEWKHPEFDGVDRQDFGQKYVCDALGLLGFIDRESVDEIVMNHFLEHLCNEDAVKMLNVCWELLKPDKHMNIEVPHVFRGTAWVLSHKSYYSETTFTSIEYKEHCDELGLKPFKVASIHTNKKKNIYCDLKKVGNYIFNERSSTQRTAELMKDDNE